MNVRATGLAASCQKLLAGLFAILVLSLAFAAPASAQEIPPPKTLTYAQGWTKCASDGGWCNFFGGVRDVAYGANGKYIYLLGVQDNTLCNQANFWDADPAHGIAKSCYVSNGRSRLANARVCASENGMCTFTGSATVWFGSAGQFIPRQVVSADGQSNTVHCHLNVFGDPNRGLLKYCMATP